MENLYNTAAVFLDIFSGLMPYFLLGLLLSGGIELFVPCSFVRKIRQNRFLAILWACLLGTLVPAAKGGVLPVARRLAKKGVPLYAVLALLVAAPLLNFLTMWNTLTAFGWGWLLLARWGGGLLLAFETGLIFSLQPQESTSLAGDERTVEETNGARRWAQFCRVVIDEFFDWIPWFTLGALLAAVMRVFLPLSNWMNLGVEVVSLQVVVAMLYGMILSISSTIDSFVVLNWVGHTSQAALVAFLLAGAVVDVRGLVMMVKGFGFKTSLYWSLLIGLSVLLVAFLIQFGLRGLA